MSALLLTACGAPEYSVVFQNDLSSPVVVRGCEACGSGHVVQPSETWRYRIGQDVDTKVTMVDGSVIGCAYIPSGASSSDPIPQRASGFEGLICDAERPSDG